MRPAASALPHGAVRLCIALSCACVAGCHERVAPPASTGTPAPQSRAEWRGRLPCADCDAIDARLVLQRGGGRGDGYRLVETYRSGNAAARFVEQGRWQREQTLLRLRGDAGSVRFYALLPDGRLQPRGKHGAALDPAGGDALVPVSAEYTP
jgi:NlpE-like protein